MTVTITRKVIDANTDEVTYRENGKVICIGYEPNAAAAAAEAAKQATLQGHIDVLEQLLDSGRANPAPAALNKALAFAALTLLKGRDAAIAAVK